MYSERLEPAKERMINDQTFSGLGHSNNVFKHHKRNHDPNNSLKVMSQTYFDFEAMISLSFDSGDFVSIADIYCTIRVT